MSPDVLISAMEQKNLARRLAEPNLTTLSGQTASFHAGGQVPVCTISSTTVVVSGTSSPTSNQCSVSFKDFGVQLEFTPTVLDDGLINLAVAPEVSDIDPSININGNVGFTTRRASTRVQLRDGQSFAIAGLLQTINAQTANQLPWLGDIPILGTLFRSSEFQKKQTDLVIIVTPRIARPVGTEQVLQTPLDSTSPANEPEFFLLGKQEVSRKDLDQRYHGQYGFIVDLQQGAKNGQ
jgi:pilus assembly protein CpaC